MHCLKISDQLLAASILESYNHLHKCPHPGHRCLWIWILGVLLFREVFLACFVWLIVFIKRSTGFCNQVEPERLLQPHPLVSCMRKLDPRTAVPWVTRHNTPQVSEQLLDAGSLTFPLCQLSIGQLQNEGHQGTTSPARSPLSVEMGVPQCSSAPRKG